MPHDVVIHEKEAARIERILVALPRGVGRDRRRS